MITHEEVKEVIIILNMRQSIYRRAALDHAHDNPKQSREFTGKANGLAEAADLIAKKLDGKKPTLRERLKR